MKTALLPIQIFLVFFIFSSVIIAQENEKSTMLGNLNTEDEAMNIVADNLGNTFVGGRSERNGILIKQNAAQQVLWSKFLSFTSNVNHQVSVDFLDLLGDTLFGCGRIHLANTQSGAGIGSFYFKMNAQTGALYWAKFETSGPNSFTTMRYANGKYFLVGSEYGINKRGRVIAVSSQNGNLIWQTPCINYNIVANTTNQETTFLGATEMVNGKMYITGSTHSYNPGTSVGKGVPLLIGISETGTIFLHRYFNFPGSTVEEFVGSKINFDSDKHLILGTFEKFYGAVGNVNSVCIKCDTLGNILFSNFYAITPSIGQYITHMNETPSSYVFYGYSNSTVNGMYAMKISKLGLFQKCILLTKPNTFYHPIPYTSEWKTYGNSSFINGKHYFPATESNVSVVQLDVNKIILDENLDYAEDCSQLTEIFPTTINVPTTLVPLVPLMVANSLTYSNGGILEDSSFIIPCSSLSLNLHQNQICEQVAITVTVSGFVDPSFYWSNGAGSNLDTIFVNTMDTVFVRVLDTKCCELVDTIVPNIIPSSFAMNLPNDTTICVQNGGSFSVDPVFSGANGPVTFQWNTNSTNETLDVFQSGTYWIDISDNCNTLSDTINIQVNYLPMVSNTASMYVCEGSFPVSLNPTVSVPANIVWDDGSNSLARVVNGPGNYTLIASNNCGSVTATIPVLQIDLPEVQLIPFLDSCIYAGDFITLNPIYSNTLNQLWSNGSNTAQLQVSSSGIYKVFASNSCGVDSASCLVIINYFPELNLPTHLDTCFEIGVGFSYTASGSAGTYNWSSGSQSATEWISQEGIYSVTLTNQCGSTTDFMEVSILAVPDLFIPEDSLNYCQRNLAVSMLNIETNYELEVFSPFQHVVLNSLEQTGWYTIHAFNGCWHKYDSVFVDLQEETFYLPNSFTPNGDSYNDRLEFKGDYVPIREISIYNRWGEEIYSENGTFSGWDGTYTDEKCPDGMYLVQLIYEDCQGMPTTFTGHVNLIR